MRCAVTSPIFPACFGAGVRCAIVMRGSGAYQRATLLTWVEKCCTFAYIRKGDKKAVASHSHELDHGKDKLKRYKDKLKHSVMKTFEKYIGIILIALLGLSLLVFGVYCLTTATSNIASFRLAGLAPALLGGVMLLVAPTAKAIN